MKLAIQVISAVLAAAFLALVAVVAWAFMSGLVTMEKLEAARQAMVSAPAAVPAENAKPIASHYVDEELKEKQRSVEERTARSEALAMEINGLNAEIARMQAEAVRKNKELSERESKVAREEKAVADARAAHDKLTKGAAFRRQVETFESMKERDAARHLYAYENASALELLRAFDAGFRAKVLEEIDRLDRSPENAGRAPKAPSLFKGLWPGETAAAGR